MAHFNKKEKQFKKIENKAGGVSYVSNKKINRAKETIANIILTARDPKKRSFYPSFPLQELEEAVNTLVENAEEEYVLKAAAFARRVGALRTVSHYTLINYFERKRNNPSPNGTFHSISKTLVRPDDATEIVAGIRGKSIPNALRKAIRFSLENVWDGYQLRKYYGTGKVKVSDLIKLSHPKPKDSVQSELFNRAVKGKRFLPKIETAQTVNTEKNESVRDRSVKYLDMVRNKKLGYMALLKNIVNIVKGLDAKEVEEVCEALEVQKAIFGSKVLPMRFIQAYVAVRDSDLPKQVRKRVIQSLEKAILVSSKRVAQKMDIEEGEGVHFIIDVSGSMDGDPIFNAISLAIPVYVNARNAGHNTTLSVFATKYKNISESDLGVFEIIEKYFDITKRDKYFKSEYGIGWSTEIASALEAIKENVQAGKDSVIVFSDMQLYDSAMYDTISVDKYQRIFKDNMPKKTIFWDISSYNTGTPFKADSKNSVYSIAGLSGLLFEYLDILIEEGSIAKVIENFNL